MRVCVFGAGAIGGHLAGRLARGGADVSVVARGAHLAAIRSAGLTIEAPDAHFTVSVRAVAKPAELGPQDAVFVTVKAPALGSVAATIAPLLGPETPVAFVLNGIPWWYFDHHGGELDGTRLAELGPVDTLHAAVPLPRVLGGVVNSACTVIRPGVVEVGHNRNRLVLGEPAGGPSARADRMAEPLRAGGFTVDISPRIRDDIWSKLLGNLCTGPLAVLTQSTLGETARDPACEAAVRTVAAEGRRIAQALGCTPTHDVDRMLASFHQSKHQPSILQDLNLGRPMEIDGIYGAPLALARLTGVDTPMLDLLVAMAKQRARAAGLYQG